MLVFPQTVPRAVMAAVQKERNNSVLKLVYHKGRDFTYSHTVAVIRLLEFMKTGTQFRLFSHSQNAI